MSIELVCANGVYDETHGPAVLVLHGMSLCLNCFEQVTAEMHYQRATQNILNEAQQGGK